MSASFYDFFQVVSSKEDCSVIRGGFRGGGAGGERPPPPPAGIRPPADPKGPPFDTFSEIQFWPTDPKFFSKGAFGTNIY